jgi:hypothetical protein
LILDELSEEVFNILTSKLTPGPCGVQQTKQIGQRSSAIHVSQNRHLLFTEHCVTERQRILHDPITRILRTYDQITSLTPFDWRRFVSLLRRLLQVDSGFNQESESPFLVGDYFEC